MLTFLIPTAMALGLAMVSAPIIIHLINRMRFKRIRWAAMEFLLKSQKRNRRRLIIEQLLLLLLRCSLVLLAAFLVSRFVGCNNEKNPSGGGMVHYVLIDDSLSMTDAWKENGVPKDAFTQAKGLVGELARKLGTNNTSQEFHVAFLSDPGNNFFHEKLGNETIAELGNKLDDPAIKATSLHLKPEDGVAAAAEFFDTQKGTQRQLHIVSDFRTTDWVGPEATELSKRIDGLLKSGITVNLIDCAGPTRNQNWGVSTYHQNVAVVDLRADTRVAALGMPVQFSAVVQNFSPAAAQNLYLTVKVNGVEELGASQPIASINPNSAAPVTFMIPFKEKGFNQITATLREEPEGLRGDDMRFALVDVRDQVEILMIDGNGANGLKPGGDTFFLQTVFTSAQGYAVVPRNLDELEKGNLDQYPSIYLLNVPEIKNEKALKNLEEYVKRGGHVCFFLGDKVKPGWYNEMLYKDGQGMLPVPLAEKFNYQKMSEEDKFKKLFLEEQQKVYLRDEKHPMLADAYKWQAIFRYLILEGYWPTLPRNKWQADKATYNELMTLPNDKPLENFRATGNTLNNALPVDNEEKYGKFTAALKRHQNAIKDALLNGKELWELAVPLQNLLNDEGDPEKKDERRPNLKADFWKLPEMQNLHDQLESFRQTVQYGDPLAFDHKFGKGQVVLFLTTSGNAWHQWPGGCPASPTYPMIMVELEKYLTSGGEEINRVVGSPLSLELDAGRYDTRLSSFYQPEIENAAVAPAPAPVPGVPRAGLEVKGDRTGVVEDNKVKFGLPGVEFRKPGVYLFDVYPRPEVGGPEAKPEHRAYVFNVDALAEGDLKRATKEDVDLNPKEPVRGRGRMLYSEQGGLVTPDPKSDTSESPWLFLIILGVLVVEQLLAVHLSFHLKGNEAQLPQQVMRPHGVAA
jgi:Aerotolerance regulator N-terminal